MSVMDKFLDSLRFNGDDLDDDYDDYDEEDEVEEAPKRKAYAKVDNDFEDEKPKVKTTPKVTPMRQPRRMGNDGMEVCVIKPTTVEDAREITETLLANRTVVLNLEGLDVDIAQVGGQRS